MSDRLRRKHLCQRRIAARQIVYAIADKRIDLGFELWSRDKGLKAFLAKIADQRKRVVIDSFVQTPFQQIIDLPIDKSLDCARCLIALQHCRDVFSQPVLQRRNSVEHRRARAGRQCFDH